MQPDITADLQAISPYTDKDVNPALQRLLAGASIKRVVNTFFPKLPWEQFLSTVNQTHTIEALQDSIIALAINAILSRTSPGLTLSGFEQISATQTYTFLSNHRDIVLDPALFARSLRLLNFQTPKVCLGDNLLFDKWMIDLVKLNKGITVKRNQSGRELYRWSHALSELIRQNVTKKIDSVWIAQSEGRAKDGKDLTHPGVLKMLALSGEKDLISALRPLNIVPLAISYEFDPCDALKARELFLAEKEGGYIKEKGEDLTSILKSFHGEKGRIHIAMGKPLNQFLSTLSPALSKPEQVDAIVKHLNETISTLYLNWPSNYIAHDLLGRNKRLSGFYQREAKEYFIKRMQRQVAEVAQDPSQVEGICEHFLSMYANSVRVP